MTHTSAPRTLFDKIWEDHLIRDYGDGFGLVFVDRQVLQELGAPWFDPLKKRGLKVPYPRYNFAVSDHSPQTLFAGRRSQELRVTSWTRAMRERTEEHGITHFDIDSPNQGISSIVAGELGIALPGATVTVYDSHGCTLGATGAAAWASGAGEVTQTLATQTSLMRKPPTMRINIEGKPGAGVSAKDVLLHVIRKVGAGSAAGHAVELAGSAIRAMTMEERFTACNLGVELGSRTVQVAPDETTFEYLKGRKYAPTGANWDAAVNDWRALPSDAGAKFDREATVDVSGLEPQISWGISPGDVIGISERVPDPRNAASAQERSRIEGALSYTGLKAGAPFEGTPIDFVFIGSCANNRISDLRLAAGLAKGRKVAGSVVAWVIPGSQLIKKQAEDEGLDEVFRTAGFNWGEPGCSMCGGQGNGFTEILKPGMRAVSTISRNFPNRQGRGSITHLASPAMAVAAAVAGCITDVRKIQT